MKITISTINQKVIIVVGKKTSYHFFVLINNTCRWQKILDCLPAIVHQEN